MVTPGAVTPEVAYVLLVFGLFVVPKALQRFRVPGAITSLVLGGAVSLTVGYFAGDTTIPLFATLGIVALFLFAGLEVDFEELQGEIGILVWHLALQLATIALLTAVIAAGLGLAVRAAVLVALALATPSTGFILDSLGGYGLSARERFWVKSKAISTELVALAVLFVVLQSDDSSRFGLSFLALGGLVVLVPIAFRLFARLIQPFAPNSEFAFLLIVALVCAFVTRQLGVYYLVGAFLVGVAAQRFRKDLPALVSDQMLRAIELFASFFVPFYFFNAGSHIARADLTWTTLVAGIALAGIVVPLRTLVVMAHRHVALREPWQQAFRVSTPLLPTFVFTLVIAEILRERFVLPAWLFGALVVYTVLNTILPGLVLRVPSADPDLLVASDVPVAHDSTVAET
jgi:Kef-type K+ transport system membrane component KefB